MKKRILCLAFALLFLLPGCKPDPVETARLNVLTTTYPIYLFANTLTQGVEGVSVERLDTGSISCLHDYNLSVGDMKKIEGAGLIALNGVELEAFMDDALASAQAAVVDCSQGVELLENLNHHHEEGEDDHDHGHYDPHIWMDPDNAAIMVQNLAEALISADPDHAQQYEANRDQALEDLDALGHAIERLFEGASTKVTGLVTFHDGFQYFAKAFDLPLLAAIEEEAGSEASAKEINEITAIVNEKHIPVIFTERNGSDATAQAIARETGCTVSELTMLMSGEKEDLSGYADGLMQNAAAIINGFAGARIVSVG